LVEGWYFHLLDALTSVDMWVGMNMTDTVTR